MAFQVAMGITYRLPSSFRTIFIKRINFDHYVRRFSTESPPRPLTGTPSEEGIGPKDQGFSFFMKDALNYEERIKIFITPKSIEDELKQLIQVSSENSGKGVPQRVNVPTESIMSLLKEIRELEQRVARLEGRITRE